MKLFIGGFDHEGQPIALTPATLRGRTGAWPISPNTPEPIAGLLETSRDLFTMSYFEYEFLTIGVLVSLQAVESALRFKLEVEQPLIQMIKRAAKLELITAEEADRLDAGRQLRNNFSHPTGRTVWTFGMTAPLIEASHEMVAKLFA